MAKVIDLMIEKFGSHLWSINETMQHIMSIKHEITRVFVILAYLGSLRRGEICQFIPDKYKYFYRVVWANSKNIPLRSTNKQYLFVKSVNEKPSNAVNKKRVLVNKVLVPDYEFKRKAGIRKKDIFIEVETYTYYAIDEGKEGKITWLIISSRNNKNLTRKYKRNPIDISNEGLIVQELLRYLKEMSDDDEIIRYTPGYMYKLMKKHAPEFIRPHFLRALRTQHLHDIYKFSDVDIQDFNGWSSTFPLSNYRALLGNSGIKDRFKDYARR